MGRNRRQHEQRQVQAVADEFRMSPEQRYLFSRWIHDCKAKGDFGSKNDLGDFTMDELRMKVREFLNIEESQ